MDSAFARPSRETLAIVLFQAPLSPPHQPPSRQRSFLLVLKFLLQDAWSVCLGREADIPHGCANGNFNKMGLSELRLEDVN